MTDDSLPNDQLTNSKLNGDKYAHRTSLPDCPNPSAEYWLCASKILVDNLGSAEAVFKAKKSSLEMLDGIGSVRANNIKFFQDFNG